MYEQTRSLWVRLETEHIRLAGSRVIFVGLWKNMHLIKTLNEECSSQQN